jgi:hypothetical protein
LKLENESLKFKNQALKKEKETHFSKTEKDLKDYFIELNKKRKDLVMQEHKQNQKYKRDQKGIESYCDTKNAEGGDF